MIIYLTGMVNLFASQRGDFQFVSKHKLNMKNGQTQWVKREMSCVLFRSHNYGFNLEKILVMNVNHLQIK